MTDGQKPNKPLFSQHYLEHRIQECPEWQVDVSAGFGALQKLYLSKKDLLPTLSEAQTEEVFIKPALDILGFSHIPQVTTRGTGRAERPDYALFTQVADRDAAYRLQNDEPAFYARVRAIAEAKYWERSLSKVSSNDQRDIYKNTNPSFQISSYLTGTGVDWGILTNGREWRLYYRQASSTATEFYPVDLVELLESGNLERFKYFWLFFRQEALVKDPHGRNFLERVREGSTTYATRVGNELKALVFDRVFPGLAGGFVADATRRGEQVTSAQVYEATLSFLYKLLFLLYAEARNLLPIDRDYRDHSLIKMTQEVAQGIEHQKKLSQTSTGLYDRLLSLFQIVDRGDPGLDVPRYNGGLFHFDFSQPSDRTEYQANHFLFRFKLSDAVLAPVLDQLARFEGQPIDYGFLGVRQLGSIYEGLLEYRVVINAGESGTRGLSPLSLSPLSEVAVHLENDKGERKATGSYYTPDYIVKYIVSHTLKPILEQRQARFGELMVRIAQLHTQMQDKRLGVQSLNGLRKDLQRLEREAQSTLLDIKICDPAMGSGHFLVEAVDYLTDELIRILTVYPEQNPVLEMLEQTRQSILQNLQQQGITVNPDRLEPTQLLQRVVMKRCIYGVDLNPMAVELAKVSLWLHSFTIGAPLSFLDHHLRCGNSLIGTTAREAEAKMVQEESGQLLIMTGPFAELLNAAKTMIEISETIDATFQQVEQSEQSFKQFIDVAEPFKHLLDVYISQYFGVKGARNFLERYGSNAINIKSEKINSADASILEKTEQVQHEKNFFHWDVEFPEVFIDLENASWKENPGFDAIVGNPPYIDSEEMTRSQPDIRDYISKVWKSASGNWDLFVVFVEAGIKFTKTDGCSGLIVPNKLLGAEYSKEIQSIIRERKLKKIQDYSKVKVFSADVYPVVYIISNQPSEANDEIELSQMLEDKVTSLVFESRKFISHMEVLDKLPEGYWWALFSSFFEVIEKVLLLSKNLEDVATVQAAASTSEAYEIADYVEESDDLSPVTTPEQLRLINTGTIDRYESLWGIEQIKYLKSSYFKPVVLATALGNISLNRVIQAKASKIILAGMTLKLEAYHDSEGIYLAGKSTVTISSEIYNNLYLLAVINSRLCSLVYRETFGSLALQGGYLTIGTPQASKLLIPKITFITLIDRRQQALQNAIALYDQLQLNHNVDPLLAQVNHHLSQQPEEADVIHDLLAHLAEQMIELNKQKQTEIKSFLQWLERFIGCPIDTLTNKSKIQNYLGDYYKKGTGSADTDNDTGELHLSFDALIELLKKNKKKITIDPVARKEQQTLEKEYQASLETLLPLKMRLMRCDRLIDAIVYKLYGLTDEEVAVVQGTRFANVQGTRFANVEGKSK